MTVDSSKNMKKHVIQGVEPWHIDFQVVYHFKEI